MAAGNEIAVQERKRSEPAITACHRGTANTTMYPAMEIKLKTTSERFTPNRSASHPPGMRTVRPVDC